MLNLKIFISYCHEDESYKDELLKYIKPIIDNQSNIELWHDRLMKTGDELKNIINNELEEMSLMICLISADYLGSNFCIQTELKAALEQRKINKNNIFPIILRKCGWKHTVFSDLLCQPLDGKPVKEWGDKDDVYTDIADALADVIKSLKSDNTVKKKL
ncbi:MAG TPA: toll/interleukin-1 receptor domain-containing protein [Acinetobacter venetianus]|uniref:toll/interleukin-1 receptor domain-containing protein n=1 Tax=Acinetobacter venetianus TaxID=52133 RepID=UPI001A15D89F|nr:toll/interleukin-1 receptor domain-containing protein [Acinetobacter venetianus]HIQ35656.1 toll/interleukin-1 receptor domain-containing protein [Acinetobacter venetianus]